MLWLSYYWDFSHTSLGNDLFAFGINYNDPSNSAKARYDRAVTEGIWKTANYNAQRSYLYDYDAFGRITAATSSNTNYNLGLVQYDKMGNITRLKRNGHRDVNATTFGLMDDLTYQYNGNQLKSINDATAASATMGFIDGVENATEYQFDANGNMVRDDNKDITDIDYNHLNMPTKVTVTGPNSGTLDYVYDATGVKIRKINSNGTTTDYIGNFVYENGSLKQITHAEGYIEPDGSSWQYVYRYTDIWGNTRITYADDNGNGSIEPSTEIRREQNYYPFGMEHKGYNSASYGVENNLKTYQAQEFTEDLGLDVHEWRYRMSDPATGRFWQIDPLAEDYFYNSTYAFQENKLGSGVELEGLENEAWTTDDLFEQQMFNEMSQEVQAVFTELGAFIDSFFVSESNTVKEEVSKVGSGDTSNTTTIESNTTTTTHTNLESFISNIRPDENGEGIMPNIPVTVTEQTSSVSIKNTTQFKVNLRGPVSVTEKLSLNSSLISQDSKLTGSIDLGFSQSGNSAGLFLQGSTSSNGDTKVRAGIRSTVKRDNISSTFTFGFEHKIEK